MKNILVDKQNNEIKNSDFRPWEFLSASFFFILLCIFENCQICGQTLNDRQIQSKDLNENKCINLMIKYWYDLIYIHTFS
jgi:hypothetical protein